MSTVNPSQSSAGNEITADSINAPINQLAAVINGDIDENNLADGGVTTGKLADDAVTAGKINFGGAGAGVWWEEIARTTLGVAGDTITVSSIPARAYLCILVFTRDTGGTNTPVLTFNNDGGTNYARRISINGAADTTSTSQTNISLTNPSAGPHFVVIHASNSSTEYKLAAFVSTSENGGGAATVPERIEGVLKWASTSQVTRVDITNSGTGDFQTGSEVIVLGHD